MECHFIRCEAGIERSRVWKMARGAWYCERVLCWCVKKTVSLRKSVKKKKNKRKTSVAKRGGQHSITRHPSSRAADEGETICLSCQQWGELGICQLCPTSLIQRDKYRHTHTSLHPHSYLDTLAPGNRWQHMGLFHWCFWPRRVKPCHADFHFHRQFNRAQDVPQLEQGQSELSRPVRGTRQLLATSAQETTEKDFLKSLFVFSSQYFLNFWLNLCGIICFFFTCLYCHMSVLSFWFFFIISPFSSRN